MWIASRVSGKRFTITFCFEFFQHTGSGQPRAEGRNWSCLVCTFFCLVELGVKGITAYAARPWMPPLCWP